MWGSASTTSPIPDSSSATWTIPRNGDGHLTIQAFHSLVHSGAECNSDDQALGEPGAFADAEACAAACAAQDGCSYFIFGTGSKAGDCYWEKTSSSACTEGWESDEFDFYSVARGSTTLYVGVLAYSSTSFSISSSSGVMFLCLFTSSIISTFRSSKSMLPLKQPSPFNGK